MSRHHDQSDGAADDAVNVVVAEVRSDGERLSSGRAARQRQAIADAIAAEQRGRQRAISPAAAAVLALGVAGAAVAGTLAALSPSTTTTTPATAATSAGGEHVGGVVDDGDDSVPSPAPLNDPADGQPSATATATMATSSTAAAPRNTTTTTTVVTTTATTTTARAPSLDALVAAALDGGRGDVLRLGQRFSTDVVATDDALAIAGAAEGDDGVRARRLRCELQLRFGRTAAALNVCAAYVQNDGDDEGARPLAFGAGGLAEELGLLDDATRFYTSAIVLSPLSGATSYDALKARARVHARAGRLDDARADLRLFIEARSAAALDDDVIGLATRLGVDLSPTR